MVESQVNIHHALLYSNSTNFLLMARIRVWLWTLHSYGVAFDFSSVYQSTIETKGTRAHCSYQEHIANVEGHLLLKYDEVYHQWKIASRNMENEDEWIVANFTYTISTRPLRSTRAFSMRPCPVHVPPSLLCPISASPALLLSIVGWPLPSPSGVPRSTTVPTPPTTPRMSKSPTPVPVREKTSSQDETTAVC